VLPADIWLASQQKLSGKVLQAYQILAIEEESEELQRQTQNSNCNVHETATSKGRALHSAFLVTPRGFTIGRFSPDIAELPPLRPAHAFGG